MFRKVLSLFLAILIAAGGPAAAAPPRKKPPVKKRTDVRDRRIEQLEKQLRQQRKELDAMQKQLQEMQQRMAAPAQPAPTAAETPTPSAAQTPAAGQTPAPTGAETPAAAQSPATDRQTASGPLIDDSVPPSGDATPAPQPSPSSAPEGPLLDDSVPPSTDTTSQGQNPQTTNPQQQGPSTGTGQTLFNPLISAVGLFEARTSTDKSNDADNQFSAREVELALQSPIDPYARLDVFLAIPSGESLELEEGYATFLQLPLQTQGKMGKFKAFFGRNNYLHAHAWPQIDRPKVIENFFGEEGLNGAGVSLGTLLPTPWYSEFTAQAFTNDKNVLFSGGNNQKPIYMGNWRNLFELREDLTMELGLSGAYGKVDSSDLRDTGVGGAALTFKYKPLERAQWFHVTWESEFLTETQRIPVMIPQASPGLDESGNPLPEPPPLLGYEKKAARGLYSYLEVQPDRNWFFGARYDWTHMPLNPDQVIKGWTGLLGYRFSEFNELRLQYSDYARNWAPPLRQWFFQWNVSVGPHGAHKY